MGNGSAMWPIKYLAIDKRQVHYVTAECTDMYMIPANLHFNVVVWHHRFLCFTIKGPDHSIIHVYENSLIFKSP